MVDRWVEEGLPRATEEAITEEVEVLAARAKPAGLPTTAWLVPAPVRTAIAELPLCCIDWLFRTSGSATMVGWLVVWGAGLAQPATAGLLPAPGRAEFPLCCIDGLLRMRGEATTVVVGAPAMSDGVASLGASTLNSKTTIEKLHHTYYCGASGSHLRHVQRCLQALQIGDTKLHGSLVCYRNDGFTVCEDGTTPHACGRVIST